MGRYRSVAPSPEKVARYVRKVNGRLKKEFPEIYRKIYLSTMARRSSSFISLKVLVRDRAKQFTTALAALHALRDISLRMKPPEKIRVQTVVPNLGSFSIFLPHNYYKLRRISKGLERVLVGSITLLIPKGRKDLLGEEILKTLTNHAKRQPHIVMNTVEESLGSIYFLQNHLNDKNPTVVRSLLLNGMELDLIALSNKGPLHVVEVLSAHRQEQDLWRRKLKEKDQRLSTTLKGLPLSWELHYVLVGPKNSLKTAMEVATSILTERTVHALDINTLRPLKVVRL